MSLNAGVTYALPFVIGATELDAGTTIEVVSPTDGYVTELQVIVQAAVVTGGTVTANIGTTPVGGLSVAVANAATKGTVVSDVATSGTATRKVTKGQRLQIVPSAAFTGGGALSGNLLLTSSDLSPVAPF